MKVLIIGGQRHGEFVDDLPDGIRGWVDIRTATTHVVRRITWAIPDQQTKLIAEAYVLHAAVHPDYQGPDEPAVAGELLRQLAMNDFMRAHGEAQEIPKEPAGSSLIVPGGSPDAG